MSPFPSSKAFSFGFLKYETSVQCPVNNTAHTTKTSDPYPETPTDQKVKIRNKHLKRKLFSIS